MRILIPTLILLLAGCGPDPEDHPGRVDPDPAHQTCSHQDQCVMVYLDCSSCDCGTAVNIQYQDTYHQAYLDICPSYQGPVCESYCPPQQPVCREGLCLMELIE